MLRIFYTLLYHTVMSFLMPREFFKRPSGRKLLWLRHKLGHFKESLPTSRRCVWIHAVSVGEVMAISSLVKELVKDYDILLSTITDTGFDVAVNKFKNLPVVVIYLPLDCPFAIKRTLRHFKPDALLIAETELWPNLIIETSKKVPVFLINGRLTEKSFKNYKKFKFFFKKVLNSFTLLLVQTEEYKKRFLELGVEEKKIVVVGNTKFDIFIEEKKFNFEKLLPRPIVLAGSTHEPEEDIILSAFLETKTCGTLLLTPRHPQRFDEVEKLVLDKVKNKKVFYARLSRFNQNNVKSGFKVVILVDKMGILGSLYRICDVAVIGGSFIPHGGQNPLEAIYWKKPVIFGPHMFNFPFIEDFVKKEACLQVKKEELQEVLEELCKNEDKRKALGNKAYEMFNTQRGATKRIVQLVKTELYKYEVYKKSS